MDELISEGLCVFTDLDDDHGTLDLDKCGEEARLYRAKRMVADRRLAAARKKEEARAEAEAARLAKAEAAAAARRQEEERLARLRAQAKTDARAKRRTANGKATHGGPSKSNVSKSNVSKSNAKRAAERSEPNDSGAEMLMAAAALMASGEENGEVTGAVTMTDRNAGNAERSAKRHRGNAMPPPPSLPLTRGGSAKSARARGETAAERLAAPKTTKTTPFASSRSKEERLAEEHREKFLEATAAAEMAKRDAAAAKARADAAFEAAKRLGDSPLARIPPAPRDASLAAASPARRAATKTSLTQRLAESTAADANANFQNSPSSSVEQISGEDDGVSHEATDDDARDALGDVVAKKKPGAKPAAETRRNPRAAPASRKQVLSEDDTRVETTVENADVPNPRHQNPRHRADPSASLTFAGATPTSWIARLLTSRMSGDPTIRAAFLCALCAVEEKRLDFAERLLTEHDFECGWRFRLLEYLDRARGRDGSAADNARLARRCEAREAAAREARREREARETDALRAEEDEWRSARGGVGDGGLANARDTADGDAHPGAGRPTLVFADESDPFFDERPGAGLKILDASKRPERTKRSDGDEAQGSDENLENLGGKETRSPVPATSSGDRHAARRDTNAFVKRSPMDSAAAPGVAPSGPLPLRGASGAGAGALGAAFALFAENAGAADLEDWKRMRRLAKRDAAARPAEALTLTLAGLLAWRVGDLEGAKAPLRAAMHHDGVAARAAPLLFEVLLLLDETDEAEVVWDTALHRGESGPTYERLIAVALRCGEGGEGEPLGESDKRTEGDSERR